MGLEWSIWDIPKFQPPAAAEFVEVGLCTTVVSDGLGMLTEEEVEWCEEKEDDCEADDDGAGNPSAPDDADGADGALGRLATFGV